MGAFQIFGSGAGTTLSPVTGSPFLSGGLLTDVLALTPGGGLLLAANGDSRNLSVFQAGNGSCGSEGGGCGSLALLGVQPVDTLGATGRITGLAAASFDVTFTGTTTGGPNWNRPNANGDSPPTTLCASFHPRSSADAVPYSVTRFSVATSGTYAVQSTATNPVNWDNYTFVYQNSFNPSTPLANVLIGNDDNPSVGVSGFSVDLTAGTPYFLVVSGYVNTSFGDWSTTISGLGIAAALPSVVTGTATGISPFGAVLSGTVNPNGSATSANFEYGLTTAYGSATPAQAVGAGTVAVAIGGGTLSGLACNSLYHFRATGANAGGTSTGADATFTTSLCPLPTVVTGLASTIQPTAATLSGTVNPNGSAATARFEYGTTTAYGSLTPAQAVGGGTVAVGIAGGTLSGLTCNLLYHFRSTATNGGGTSPGAAATFTTSSCPPTVETGVASDIQQTVATLEALVNPNGSTTTARFEYGVTTAYGSLTPLQAPGTGTVAVGVRVSVPGLQCRTLYHFRATATNDFGTTPGSDATFTTRADATCRAFSDDPLTPGIPMRVGHITELREAIDALRATLGLPPFNWADPTLTAGVSLIRAQHLRDLRTALAEAFSTAGLPPPSFSDSTLGPGTPIKAVHIVELRIAIHLLDAR